MLSNAHPKLEAYSLAACSKSVRLTPKFCQEFSTTLIGVASMCLVILQAQTADFEPFPICYKPKLMFLACYKPKLFLCLSWVLHAPFIGYCKPTNKSCELLLCCYKHKLLMWNVSLLLQTQSTHVDPFAAVTICFFL